MVWERIHIRRDRDRYRLRQLISLFDNEGSSRGIIEIKSDKSGVCVGSNIKGCLFCDQFKVDLETVEIHYDAG